MDQEIKHRLEMRDRKELSLAGVLRVESFTDNEIHLETNMGFLLLQGEGLHITQLDLDAGTLVVQGHLNSLQYRETGSRGRISGRNLLNRLLK
ncbi:MAG: sporulation protein YabP [Bacillota bacterium]